MRPNRPLLAGLTLLVTAILGGCGNDADSVAARAERVAVRPAPQVA
jgi:hypothetical protein